MKAMLLAAGRGERLSPVTDHVPKPLLRIGGETLLERHLRRLANAGIREVVVNTSYLAGPIHAVLGDGSRWGLTLHISHEPDGPLETGGGMLRALPLLGQAPFLALNADVLTDLDPRRLPALRPGALAHLVLVPNPAWKQGDFALRAGQVTGRDPAGLTFSGIGIYHPELFARERARVFSVVAPLERAMAEGRVSGERFTGIWHDTGTLARLAAARRALGQPGFGSRPSR